MSEAIGFEAMTGIKRAGVLAVSLLIFLTACTEEGSGDPAANPSTAVSTATTAVSVADGPAGTSYGFFPLPQR